MAFPDMCSGHIWSFWKPWGFLARWVKKAISRSSLWVTYHPLSAYFFLWFQANNCSTTHSFVRSSQLLRFPIALKSSMNKSINSVDGKALKIQHPPLCDFIKIHFLNEQVQSIKELGDLNHLVREGSPWFWHGKYLSDKRTREMVIIRAKSEAGFHSHGVSSLVTRAHMLGLTLPFLSCVKAST